VTREHEDTWHGVGTGLAVGGIGVLLYLLLKNLGGGGGGGGGGGRGRGEGRAELPEPAIPPPMMPPPLPLPPRARDEKRLTFVMTQPTADDPSRPMSFRSRDEGPGARTYALDELLARVRAGGRADVTLKITGDVRESSAQSAQDLIKRAGIVVWKEDALGAAHVSGNARGSYS
jgi:hypothetical protein